MRNSTLWSNGFTLFELLVVVAVMIVIGLVGSDILINVVKGSNKVEIINKVKQNGSSVLDQMERKIRSATVVYSSVNGNGTGVVVDAINNGQCLTQIITKSAGPPDVYTKFFLVAEGAQNGYIATAQAATLASLPVSAALSQSITNTDGVSGVSLASGACFDTTYSAGYPLVVTISFTLQQAKNAPSRQDFVATVPFKTTISLRTY